MFNFFVENKIELVLIVYDRDEAGDRGSKKVAQRLMEAGIDSFRLMLPQGTDVNSYTMELADKDLTKNLAEVREKFIELFKSSIWMGKAERPLGLIDSAVGLLLVQSQDRFCWREEI